MQNTHSQEGRPLEGVIEAQLRQLHFLEPERKQAILKQCKDASTNLHAELLAILVQAGAQQDIILRERLRKDPGFAKQLDVFLDSALREVKPMVERIEQAETDQTLNNSLPSL